MREVIDEVLGGNYGSETGALDFSQATIEFSVLPGEPYQGTFWVRGEDGSVGTGSVFPRIIAWNA